jgi:hypothetical protein
METSDRVLLVLLLLAAVALPVAVFLYLRTAYRDGGWKRVKVAAIVALVSLLIPLALKLWVDWEFDNLERIIRHPFTLGSIIFILWIWLVHRTLKAPEEEMHDHH